MPGRAGATRSSSLVTRRCACPHLPILSIAVLEPVFLRGYVTHSCLPTDCACFISVDRFRER